MKALQQPKIVAAITFAIGVALAGVAAWLQTEHDAALAAARFDALVARTVAQVETRLRTYEYALRGARGSAISTRLDQLSRARFHDYSQSRDLKLEFPGARGVGLVRRVPAAEEPQFTVAARRDGAPQFAVQQLAPHGDERYVVQYFEPVNPNLTVVGLDLGSEPHLRHTAEQALRSGRAALSAPISLNPTESTRSGRSFLLMLPIYGSGADTRTADARQAAGFGWAFTLLDIDEVFADIAPRDAEITLSLRDSTEGPAASPFFATSGSEDAATAGLARQVALPLFGRTWEVEVRAGPGFLHGLKPLSPLLVGAQGVAIAALLAAIVYGQSQGGRRRLQLQTEQARRAAIVDSATDAIIGASLDGTIIEWNLGAERLFGYAAAQVVGSSGLSLLLPADRLNEDHQIRHQVAQGQAIAPYDTVRRTHDGQLIDVSIAASPMITPDGRVIGLAKTVRDIRSRRHAERQVQTLNATLEHQVEQRTAELESAQRDLRNVLDAVPSLIAYWDSALRNRFANRAYREWFGLAPQQISGMAIQDVLGNQYELSRPLIEAAIAGQAQTYERPLTRHDPVSGAKVECHTLVQLLPDTVDGRVIGMYAVVNDITAVKAAELSLAHERHLMDMLMATVPDQIYFKDQDSRFLRISPSLARRYGLSDPAQAVGKSDADFFTADHAKATAALERTIMASDTPVVNLEEQEYWPDRPATWNMTTKMPLRDTAGRIVGTFGVSRDITARKKIEADLQQSNDRFALAAEAAGIGVWEWDLVNQRLSWDDRMYALYRHSRAGPSASPSADPANERYATWRQSLHPDDRERAERDMQQAAAGTHELDSEYRIVCPDGEQRHLRATARVQRDADGRALRMTGVNLDITPQKKHEEALRLAMHKARHANLAKSQFLANMSHEIRTPMNAVIGLSVLLGHTPLDDAQAAYLDKLKLASKSLLAVINDVLDLSKIESGEMTVEHVAFSPQRVLDDVADVMAVHAQAKKIKFVVLAQEALPPALCGDGVRLSQILVNLVSNAVKFTEAGAVRLTVLRVAERVGRVKLRFMVQDSGIGISQDEQRKLFMPFSQADASTTRRFGGTGLGLSIVKRLVDLMGGDIGLASTPGVGSEFWVELEFPLDSAEALPQAMLPSLSASSRPLANVRVLVVDDSEINLEVARHILELHGASVTVAENGATAVDWLRRHPNNVDLVLMDIQMPVMDGYEATRLIRQELGMTRLPVVALTAGALSIQRRDALHAGLTDFLSKPFELQLMIQTILHHVGHSGHQPQTQPQTMPLALPRPPAAQASESPDPAEPAGDAWPEIAGVDGADVRRRLSGDSALFLTMLGRMLGEFSSLAPPPADSGAASLTVLGARMHKLKGSAGTLGAKALQGFAADAETACSQVRADLAARATQAAIAALQALSQAAKPSLDAHTARVDAVSVGAAVGAVPLNPAAMAELTELLKQQNFSALDRFHQLGPALRQALGEADYAKLRAHVEGLRFGDAAKVLESCSG